MIINEEGGNDESWILTGGVIQGPPQAQQMVAPTIPRANVRQGLVTAQNQGPQPQQQPAAHQHQHIRNGIMPHLWGINLSHIYAREVRLYFEFNS
jgi:hypothetical protein